MEAAPETRGHRVLRWVRPPWSAAAFCAIVPLVAGLTVATAAAAGTLIGSAKRSELVPEAFRLGSPWSRASEDFFFTLGPFAMISIATFLVTTVLERRIG